MSSIGRRDDVQALYNKHNKLTFGANILFALNVAALILLAILPSTQAGILTLASIILTVLYIACVIVNEIFVGNAAEAERRKTFIKDSFNINITSKKTVKYYNNIEQPSIIRMGLNCYESIFFTHKILKQMLPARAIRLLLLVVPYIVVVFILGNNTELVLCVTQTLFSAEVIISFIKLCYYYIKVGEIQEKLRGIFIITPTSHNREPLLVAVTMEYECVKSYCKVALSSRIFNKNNEKWSHEWDKLLREINSSI